MKRECSIDQIDGTPNQAAVFLLWPPVGAPYLAKTGMLRRRLLRLLGERQKPSRLLDLRGVVDRVEYWLTASGLESSLLHYELARQHFPDNYLKLTKLRMPAYVKLTLSNQFPRLTVSTRFSARPGAYFGPFRSRGSAELFGNQTLELFQIRRCQENLEPRPDHPGCIYGEMNMCLRPCQQIVRQAEYESEVGRLLLFLRTAGGSLMGAITSARERASEAMDFEEAARLHKRLQKIESVGSMRDELVADSANHNGVAVLPSLDMDAVSLRFLLGGTWQQPQEFSLVSSAQQAVSIDSRLRELVSAIRPAEVPLGMRQEHLAILARWFYSSWRDGEWLAFGDLDRAPYRKLVNAISRVARSHRGSASS